MVDNLLDSNAQEPPAKEIRLEQFSQAGPSAALTVIETISEEAVRRQLKRPPMTTTDLVTKLRFLKTFEKPSFLRSGLKSPKVVKFF